MKTEQELEELRTRLQEIALASEHCQDGEGILETAKRYYRAVAFVLEIPQDPEGIELLRDLEKMERSLGITWRP